ncbi:hypothetical protein Q5P01_022677 [Channa striata]|uniref:Uncharacterized protein n=1 Tax=Channa striata TaxID=64152 RepID=A0AA88LRF9_CHASR|nr:hypothetical protein Q5P01_022677 [Channa striata]
MDKRFFVLGLLCLQVFLLVTAFTEAAALPPDDDQQPQKVDEKAKRNERKNGIRRGNRIGHGASIMP